MSIYKKYLLNENYCKRIRDIFIIIVDYNKYKIDISISILDSLIEWLENEEQKKYINHRYINSIKKIYKNIYLLNNINPELINILYNDLIYINEVLSINIELTKYNKDNSNFKNEWILDIPENYKYSPKDYFYKLQKFSERYLK